MKKTILTIFLFLLFSNFSFSQTGEDELYVENAKADKELNIVYNKLKNKLKPIDKTALINSQKAWLKFRDLNCKFRSQEDSQGGVIANKMKIDCITQSTLERIKELKSLINDF
jgi:uncharacterized protein YecT (DUF1311 family)